MQRDFVGWMLVLQLMQFLSLVCGQCMASLVVSTSCKYCEI